MKELSIEEKAKAYDKALEKARQLCAYPTTKPFISDLQDLFPELRESKDEEIRKSLSAYFAKFKPDDMWDADFSFGDILAWLEKQGEQNPTDKTEPKFKVGDKIKLAKEPKYPAREIIAIQNDAYYFDKLVHLPFSHQDEWELVDQKPADKVEPKFKVGDSISKKHNSDINKFGIFTITSIADNKYWYNDSVVCDFSDQDLWDFVERPKFKKGDWVFHNTAEFIYMIQTIGRDGYGVISRDGKKSVVYYSAEINYRLWTIQDAKDGDVLTDHCDDYKNPLIFILKKFETVDFGLARKSDYSSYCFLSMSDKPSFNEGCFHHMSDIKPATKEQRDLLFQKMKEAGYEWDAEKKELRKIEQTPAETEKGAKGNDREIPNSAWSEDDERHKNTIIRAIHGAGNITPIDGELAEKWLKSFILQNTWKPSDEQISIIEFVMEDIEKDSLRYAILNSILEQLKKLKGE